MECLEKIYNCICCISKHKFPDPYNFTFSGYDAVGENQRNFESNYVKTSKYTWYSFLPSTYLCICRVTAAAV